MRVFLDANVLFSAALGGESFKLLWALARRSKIKLGTSRYCLTEAQRNLRAKRPTALERLPSLMRQVEVIADSTQIPDWVAKELPAKDAPVLATALAYQASVLLTGDLRHFGKLMKRTRLPLRVRTVRAFLLEGPEG